MSKRKTIDRDVVVAVANRMIEHLAKSGTHVDQVKREAIIAVSQQILLDGNSYHGFSYLAGPKPPYDNTRIALY
jgi:hypothetical protein